MKHLIAIFMMSALLTACGGGGGGGGSDGDKSGSDPVDPVVTDPVVEDPIVEDPIVEDPIVIGNPIDITDLWSTQTGTLISAPVNVTATNINGGPVATTVQLQKVVQTNGTLGWGSLQSVELNLGYSNASGYIGRAATFVRAYPLGDADEIQSNIVGFTFAGMQFCNNEAMPLPVIFDGDATPMTIEIGRCVDDTMTYSRVSTLIIHDATTFQINVEARDLATDEFLGDKLNAEVIFTYSAGVLELVSAEINHDYHAEYLTTEF